MIEQIHVVAGTAESASNAETTMTQLVQEFTIRAQVRALCKSRGIRIDRTEHVANSLGHLAAVVDQLNSLDHPLKVIIMRLIIMPFTIHHLPVTLWRLLFIVYCLPFTIYHLFI